MSLVIRLASTGKKGERKFRIIVKEKRSKRNGRAIEVLGWYQKGEKDKKYDLDTKRFEYWLSCGAKPSQTVSRLIKK